MHRRLLRAFGVGLALAVSTGAIAQPGIRPDPLAKVGDGNRGKRFQGMLYEAAGGDQVPFVLLTPDNGEKLPLVLFFHGEGGRRHNGSQVEGFVRDLAGKRNMERLPCVIVAPQAPSGWGGVVTETLGHVRAIVDSVSKDSPVDPKRVLVIGVGEGAIAALAFAAQHPQAVRGVVAASPEGDVPAEVESGLTDMSIAFAYEGDSAPEAIAQLHDRLRSAGGRGKVTLLRTGAGENDRSAAIDWLFRL